MMKKILAMIDKFINAFLIKYVDVMPMRFVKKVAYYYTDAIVRKLYLKRLGVIMGEGSFSNLGLNVTTNEDFSTSVLIGKNVSIATNVTFIPNSLPNNSKLLMENAYIKNNLIKQNQIITVEDDVWIGANVVIMPGVTLKKGCVIGAGAVVLKDTEPFSIYAGVPAKKIRNINNLTEVE